MAGGEGRDTRDLVIELGSDMRHVLGKLDDHIKDTRENRASDLAAAAVRHEAVDKKLKCLTDKFEEKFKADHDREQQVIGGFKTAKLAWNLARDGGRLIVFLGGVKAIHLLGWLR